MDPLSITAGTIAVLAAAVQSAQGIHKLLEARELPAELAAVLLEVKDLQHQLDECVRLVSHNRHADGVGLAQRFVRLSNGASEKLDELARTLTNTLGSHPGKRGPSQKFKLYWLCTVEGKGRLRDIRAEIRGIRLELVQALAELTAPIICNVQASQTVIQSTQVDILKRVDTLTTQLDAVVLTSSPSSTRHSSLSSWSTTSSKPPPFAPVAPFTTTMVEIIQGKSAPPPSYEASGVEVNQTKSTEVTVTQLNEHELAEERELSDVKSLMSCRPWCSCTCHKVTRVNSYQALSTYCGSMSLSYNGLAKRQLQCSERSCNGKNSQNVRVRFQLPRVIAKMMYMECSFNFLAGVEMRVKLPRVIDWTSPVWQYAASRDWKSVAKLFRNGLASPWDVSPIGGNLLHYATDHWSPQLCKLLLDAGVDPNSEDNFKNTGICIAWERVLSGNMSDNDSSVVASLFADADYLTQRCFTVLHKVVLGILPKDLDTELQCSTRDIDTGDSHGRTPLSWATARGDEHAIKLLLHHGANPDAKDVKGNAPLHYVPNKACAQLLLQCNASITAVNDEGQMPLYMACRFARDPDLVTYLLDSGADVNHTDYSDQAAIHNTGISMSDSFVPILLARGADVNAKNNSGDTALRFSIIYNLHDMLRTILTTRPDADFSGTNDYGQSFAHAIARTADAETMTILAKAKPPTLKFDMNELDQAGKTAMQYMEERVAAMENDKAKGEMFAFVMLAESLD